MPNQSQVRYSLSLVCFVDSAPAAAAGRFNSDALARLQPRTELSRHYFHRAIIADHGRLPGSAVAASVESPWRARATFGEQGYFAIGEDFNLADDAIATWVLSGAAAVCSQQISPHSQGIAILQGLGGRVQRIRHVGVNAGNPRLGRPRAHAAGDGFIVSEGIADARVARTQIESADG